MPCFGAVMAKMLFILLNTFVGKDKIREESNFWCAVMLGMACAVLVTGFC
jgi:hypothetical protein